MNELPSQWWCFASGIAFTSGLYLLVRSQRGDKLRWVGGTLLAFAFGLPFALPRQNWPASLLNRVEASVTFIAIGIVFVAASVFVVSGRRTAAAWFWLGIAVTMATALALLSQSELPAVVLLMLATLAATVAIQSQRRERFNSNNIASWEFREPMLSCLATGILLAAILSSTLSAFSPTGSTRLHQVSLVPLHQTATALRTTEKPRPDSSSSIQETTLPSELFGQVLPLLGLFAVAGSVLVRLSQDKQAQSESAPRTSLPVE